MLVIHNIQAFEVDAERATALLLGREVALQQGTADVVHQ